MQVTFTIIDQDNRDLRFEITDPALDLYQTFTLYKRFADGACGQVYFYNAEEGQDFTIVSDAATEEGLFINADDETVCWDGDLADIDCSALTTTCEVQAI